MSGPIIMDCQQGTVEWDNYRLGVPTSSEFNKIITSTGKESGQRQKYLYEKAGELITGKPAEGFSCSNFDRGHEREEESRKTYEFIKGVEVERIGFAYYDERRDRGASTDGLIGIDGIFESKDALPHVHIDRRENGWAMSQHKVQIQGGLYVLRREWCDLQSYSRGFKPIIIRVRRDEEFIAMIEKAIDRFNYELQELVEKHKISK